MEKYAIVWMDEQEGPVGVTGIYVHREEAIKVITDQINVLYPDPEERIFDWVMWWGGWKIECEVGDVPFAQILSLDTDVYS